MSSTKALPEGLSCRVEMYNGTSWLRAFIPSITSTNSTSTGTANTTDVTRIRFGIFIASGTTINIQNLGFQLEEGTIATEYEQYGVSPSPDHRSEVECCGDNINLFDKNNVNSSSTVFIFADGAQIGVADNNYSIYIKCKPNTTYTISNSQAPSRFRACSVENLVTGQINVSNGKVNDGGTSITITTGANDKYLYVNTGSATYNEKLKIEEGSIARIYTTYGQGCINEVICNKNILPYVEKVNYDMVTGVDYYGITYMQKVKPNTSYILSTIDKLKSGFQLREYDKEGNVIQTTAKTLGTTFITNSKTHFIKFRTNDLVSKITNPNFMLEEGKVLTDYEEHKEQVYTIPTQQPMRSVGNIRDTFIKKNGRWFERHWIKRAYIDGTESWTKSSVTSNVSFWGDFTSKMGDIDLSTIAKNASGTNTTKAQVLCNYFIVTNLKELYANRIAMNVNIEKGYIQVRLGFGLDTEIITVEKLKNWLSELNNNGNPFYIDYVLSEPLDLECTEEQNKILDELKNAKSYKGVTHIYSTDEVEPYVKSTCGSEIVPMGYYTIQKPNSEEVKEKTAFTGYDYMSKFDETYIDDGIYPIKLYDKLNSLCNQVGVELGNSEIINGDYEIIGNPFTNNETCKTVLSHIAQLACGFAKVGRDNKLYIISLSNDEDTVETLDANCYMDDFSKNDIWGEVNSLIIRLSQVEGENTTIQDEESIQKNGLTEVTINDNYYLIDNTEREKVIQEIWKNIKGVKYLPFLTTYYGFPYLDVGDKIKVYDTKDNEYTSYVFNHIFTYNGSFTGTLETKALTKTQTSLKNTNNIKTKFKNVELTVNKIDGKITQLIEENTETTEKLSKHEQTIDSMKDTIKSQETKIETVENKVSEAQTTANNAQADIDNLNIGGRNLLLGTKDLSGASLVKGKSNDTYNGFVYTDYEATTNDKYIDVLDWGNVLEPEPEQYYTLSFLGKGTGLISSYFYPSTVQEGYSSTGAKTVSNDGRINTQLTEEWTKYWIVWKTNKDVSGLKNIIVGRLNAKATGQVCIAAPKLELGNKVTDWTPAPEDVENDIANVQEEVTTKITEVERTVDGITQNVSKNTTDINNNYQEIIDKLGDKAQKDDVISLENKVETVQTNTEYAIKVSEDIQTNGVSKVKTETGYTFDENGLTIEKTNAKTKSTLNETGLEVKDSTGSQEETLLKAGYDEETGETIVKSKNMNVEKYLTVGKYSRIEDYEEGTGVFWIGGNS